MTGKTISVTPKRHGLYGVRLGHYSSIVDGDELHELFTQIAHVQGVDMIQGPDGAEMCRKCGENQRAWVRRTFCGACIAQQLREAPHSGRVA